MSEAPKISVIMITYRHDKFIQQAIESILNQKCIYNFELIIANDCSPDSSETIIQETIAQQPNPDRILHFRQEVNIGMTPNFLFAMSKAKGKYIAICDGDDYWIDPYKLQKQVDFLETNPEYVLHSGAAQIVRLHELQSEYIGLENESRTLTINDFYDKNNLITCTVMFRNILTNFPIVLNEVIFLDWCIYILLLKESNLKAYHSTEILSGYRIHPNGIMSSLSKRNNYEQHIKHILIIKKMTGYISFPENVLKVINKYSLKKFNLEIQEKNYVQSFKTFLNNFYLVSFSIELRKYLSILRKNFA